MKMNYLVSLSLNACVTIIISSCGNDEKIPKDISFDEIKTLNMEYFSRISASTRQYPLGVIRLHFGDSCMYEQLLLKNNEEGNLEFKADTTWHNIDELCIYYDCNKYNLSYSRVKVIYDFIWKYNINVNSSSELDGSRSVRYSRSKLANGGSSPE